MKHKKLLKKISVLSMIGCLLLTMLPVSYRADNKDAGPKAGVVDESTIPADAIYISTTHDLVELAENCIDEEWSRGKVFVLKHDIYMSGVDFSGIPTFGGTFLGQGHKIYGIELEHDSDILGFFRYLQEDAVVNGVILQINVQPDGSNTMIGGIAGVNKGTIRNCIVNGVVSGKSVVGGLVGVNKTSGTIENCTMNGLVHGESKVGGFVGKNQGVIRECINHAEVNTAVEHNTIGMDISNMDMDLELSLDMDMDSFGFSESMDSACDIGGIAGTNTGVIRSCVNKGNVGYEKMSTNVGGVVGSSNGYIVDCVNYAEINGADGVGGIAGQLTPSFVITFDEIDKNTSNGKLEDLEMSDEDKQSVKDALEELEKLPEDFEDIELPEDYEDFEDLKKEEFDEDKFNAAWNELSSSLGNSLEETDISLGVEIKDVSRDDTEEDTLAKTYKCVNYGAIYGVKYTGGIAGNANSETTMNMEDDITINGEMSLSGTGEIRLVIRDCVNYAKISINNKYAGGIVGYMGIGAIFEAKNLGNMNCLSAKYVGGIAGRCDTVIFDSVNKCIIAGEDYVGGIAGLGYEVYDSCALVDIAAGTKYVGTILGSTNVLPDDRSESEDEEENNPLITGNTYYIVGKNIGGIDGINYIGASKRITLEEFFAKENLADIFKNVSVRFVVEGKDDIVLTVPTGSAISLDQLPTPEVKDGEIYEWVFQKPVTSKVLGMNEVEEVLYLSEVRLTNILFNQTYEADFEPKHMVAQGKDKTVEGKVRVLAIGAFDSTTDITLENRISMEADVLGVIVNENWAVSISNIGVEELRYHIPAGMDTEKIVVYVKDAQGNWSERDFTVIGSYLAFDFSDGDQNFALYEVSNAGIGIVVAVVVVVLILAVVIFLRKKKSVMVAKKQDKE